MGNHDASFVKDSHTGEAPDSEEAEYTRWTHAQLSPILRKTVAQWPYRLDEVFEDVQTSFVHYGLTPEENAFVPILPDPSSADLDTLFQDLSAQLIAFGHDHRPRVATGQACYVNPGALGCAPSAVAQYVTATFNKGSFKVQEQRVPYDEASLYKAFEQRRVPARAFIYQAFLGSRFSSIH